MFKPSKIATHKLEVLVRKLHKHENLPLSEMQPEKQQEWWGELENIRDQFKDMMYDPIVIPNLSKEGVIQILQIMERLRFMKEDAFLKLF